jgi:hypothetical protein
MQNQVNHKSTDDRLTLPSVWICLIALYTLIAIASFLPEKRLWGINHLAYYPIPVRIGALVLMAVAFIPMVNGSVYSRLVKLHRFFCARRRLTAFAVVFVALVSVFVFYSFQASTLVLGDGDVVANTLDAAYRGDSTRVLGTLGNIHRREPIAPGTSTVYYLSSVLHVRAFGGRPITALRFLNCLLGGIFVFVFLRIILRGSLAAPLSIWVALLVFSSGAMQLFFGYVENYTPLLLLGALYVIAGIRMIHRRTPLWVPIVIFVLTAYAHVSGVLLGPSLVALVVIRVVGQNRGRVLRVLTPALIALTVLGAYLAGALTALDKYFLPLLPSQSVYSVFSPNHWVDVANELVLLVPVLPVLIVIGFRLRRSRSEEGRAPATHDGGDSPREGRTPATHDGDNRPREGRTPWLSLPEEWHFALLLLVPAVVYALLFDPEIGLARDWDLFSVLLLGLIPLLLLTVNRVIAWGSAVPGAVAVPSLVMGLVVVVSWIGVNASPNRSTARFEHILAYEESRPDYAYEILAKTYYQQGRLADAIRSQEKACSISHNVRHYLTLSRYYREYGDREAAMDVLRSTLDRRPRYKPARRELIVALFNHDRFEEAIETARTGIELNPREPFYHYYVGKSLIRLGKREEGRAALLESQQLSAGPLLTKAIAEELRRLDDTD